MKEFEDYKEWTVLIYAVGNNNLDAYIYRQFTLIKETLGKTHINILVQISRGDYDQVNLCNKEKWRGCRRYQIINGQVILIKDLGNISMAEPATLVDFLIWVYEAFPANRIMLFMSGHSAGFVGLMKEHLKSGFSIMGIKGFAKALRLFNQRTDKVIDILIMDTCFMDLVEIWYQIKAYGPKAVRYALIPQNNTPLEGLPCHEIIKVLNEIRSGSKTDEILRSIGERIGPSNFAESSVFAIDIEGRNLLILKGLIRNLSNYILDNHLDIRTKIRIDGYYDEARDYINVIYLFNLISPLDPRVNLFAIKIAEVVEQITVYSGKNKYKENKSNGIKVFLPSNSRVFFKYKYQYKKMLFNHDSRWIEVLEHIYR